MPRDGATRDLTRDLPCEIVAPPRRAFFGTLLSVVHPVPPSPQPIAFGCVLARLGGPVVDELLGLTLPVNKRTVLLLPRDHLWGDGERVGDSGSLLWPQWVCGLRRFFRTFGSGRVGVTNIARTFARCSAMFARTIRALTRWNDICPARTAQISHAFACGVAFGAHVLGGGVVVDPIVEPVAALRSPPQPCGDQHTRQLSSARE